MMTVDQTILFLEKNPAVAKGLLEGTLSLLNVSKRDLLSVISILRENNKVNIVKFWY